jgi:hypothetical protein
MMQQSSQSILIPDGSSKAGSSSSGPSLDLSVGKAILAKEVLRLRELKAHLQKQLSTPVEPDVSRNDELLALQRSFEREQELREYEIQVIRAEIMSLKAQLVDDGTVIPVPSEGSRNEDSAANGNAWATLSPGSMHHHLRRCLELILRLGLRLRHIRHFDMRFEKKIADIRRAFVSTSVENVSGLEASATDMQSFLQESTKRIAVLKERAQNLAAERPLHHIAIELLVNLPAAPMLLLEVASHRLTG